MFCVLLYLYIHNKDYEQAKAILEEGYKIINNDEFLIRLNELEEFIIKENSITNQVLNIVYLNSLNEREKVTKDNSIDIEINSELSTYPIYNGVLGF